MIRKYRVIQHSVNSDQTNYPSYIQYTTQSLHHNSQVYLVTTL